MSTLFVRRLRLGAAFVLLTYVCLHFVNHALGIVSLDAMAAGRWWFLALWRSAPGTLALYGAIAVHGLLALWLLYERRTLRMPLWEAAQYGLGLALPALALLGFVAAAREVTALARTPGWTEAMLRAAHAPSSAEAAQLLAIRRGFLGTYLIALVGVSVARGVRRLLERRRSIRITYPNGRVAVAPAGFTILDASRLAGIPHASVCGGRGRCSTCRVRIAKGLDALPAPTE